MRTRDTFFTKSSKIPQAQVDHDNARTLYIAVAALSVLRQTPNLENWANSFRLLRRTETEAVIHFTLSWYVQNLRTPYVPRAFSAASFKIKFKAIQAAMLRNGIVTVSDRAKAISDRLYLTWPKKEKEQELFFIQSSLDNYVEFLRKLHAADAAGKTPKGFASYFANLAGDPDSFVAEWIQDINDIACKWDAWEGNLMACLISEKSTRFVKYLNLMVSAWNGKDNQGMFILKVINENR